MNLPINYAKAHWSERRAAREEYTKLQGGNCVHCGAPLNGAPTQEVLSLKVKRILFPPNFFKWPVHLHHDHDTGMTIGAVHNYCNAVLWQHHGE